MLSVDHETEKAQGGDVLASLKRSLISVRAFFLSIVRPTRLRAGCILEHPLSRGRSCSSTDDGIGCPAKGWRNGIIGEFGALVADDLVMHRACLHPLAIPSFALLLKRSCRMQNAESTLPRQGAQKTS